MEVASTELVRQFSSGTVAVTTGHRQNKTLCRFCNDAEWARFPKDLPELQKWDTTPLKATESKLFGSLSRCDRKGASLPHFPIKFLKCKTLFSVVETLYCQKIPLWRTLLRISCRSTSEPAKHRRRRRDSQGKRQFHWNWGRNSASATGAQPDPQRMDGEKLHCEGQSFQKWSVVWGCIYTNISSWLSKTLQLRNA